MFYFKYSLIFILDFTLFIQRNIFRNFHSISYDFKRLCLYLGYYFLLYNRVRKQLIAVVCYCLYIF